MILKMLLGNLPEFLHIFTTATLPLTLSLRVSPKIRELIGGLCFFFCCCFLSYVNTPELFFVVFLKMILKKKLEDR